MLAAGAAVMPKALRSKNGLAAGFSGVAAGVAAGVLAAGGAPNRSTAGVLGLASAAAPNIERSSNGVAWGAAASVLVAAGASVLLLLLLSLLGAGCVSGEASFVLSSGFSSLSFASSVVSEAPAAAAGAGSGAAGAAPKGPEALSKNDDENAASAPDVCAVPNGASPKSDAAASVPVPAAGVSAALPNTVLSSKSDVWPAAALPSPPAGCASPAPLPPSGASPNSDVAVAPSAAVAADAEALPNTSLPLPLPPLLVVPNIDATSNGCAPPWSCAAAGAAAGAAAAAKKSVLPSGAAVPNTTLASRALVRA